MEPDHIRVELYENADSTDDRLRGNPQPNQQCQEKEIAPGRPHANHGKERSDGHDHEQKRQ